MDCDKEFLTVQEYALLLNIHPNTVRSSIKSGRLNAFKVGSGDKSIWRIPRSEINRMALVDLEKIIEKKIKENKSLGE